MLITFPSIGNTNRPRARRGTPAAAGLPPLTTGKMLKTPLFSRSVRRRTAECRPSAPITRSKRRRPPRWLPVSSSLRIAWAELFCGRNWENSAGRFLLNIHVFRLLAHED
jgi:hypothetical protein